MAILRHTPFVPNAGIAFSLPAALTIQFQWTAPPEPLCYMDQQGHTRHEAPVLISGVASAAAAASKILSSADFGPTWTNLNIFGPGHVFFIFGMLRAC